MPEHDVVIVGGGVAGLRAAIEAKRLGVDVALVSKTHPLRSHSCTAQAGINGAFKDGDRWEEFAADTVHGGDFLGNQDAIEVLCQESRSAVLELDAMGVPFSRDSSGMLDARWLSGSTRGRAFYASDITGQLILHTLYEQFLRAEIMTYPEARVVTLATEDGACRGVVAREARSGRFIGIGAKAVVLATGGFGQVYSRTTASLGCTGDGVALAYKAGAELQDMEMVQFHPTVLAGTGVLASEALIAEGGIITLDDGTPLLEKCDGSFGFGAPRDVVVRAIYDHTGRDGVALLNAGSITAEGASRSVKHTLDLIKSLTGKDLLAEPVAISPAAHRTMGGVRTGIDGATSLRGLYAAGECAGGGAHGANLLGGSTLTDAIVFGKRAGAAAAADAGIHVRPVGVALLNDAEAELERVRNRDGRGDSLAHLRHDLKSLMERYAGVIRSGDGLRDGEKGLPALKERMRMLGLPDRGDPYDAAVAGYLEMGNLLTCAELVLVSASARKESRGVHFRSDHPKRDDEVWLSHTVIKNLRGEPSIEAAPVTVTRWPPG